MERERIEKALQRCHSLLGKLEPGSSEYKEVLKAIESLDKSLLEFDKLENVKSNCKKRTVIEGVKAAISGAGLLLAAVFMTQTSNTEDESYVAKQKTHSMNWDLLKRFK